MKKVGKRQLLGQLGANLVERIVLQIGHVWRPTSIFDTGVDGEIEFRDSQTEQMSGSFVKVQCKAGPSYFSAETDSQFVFLVRDDDLNYWLRGNVPVLLIVCRPESNEAYWVPIQEYFKNNPKAQKDKRIIFDKQATVFDQNCASQVRSLAIPPAKGIYFPPERKSEVLQSNLLLVSPHPNKIFIADTEYRSTEDIWAMLKKAGATVTGEWFIKEKKLFSFVDLRNSNLRKACDPGTIDTIDSDEWAFSDDMVMQRDFSRLLSLALRAKCWNRRFRFNKEYGCYYYAPTKSQIMRNAPYRIRYNAFTNRSNCMFFNSYGSKDGSAIVFYYRHLAFGSHFRRFGNQWYLTINPTYIFTYDGRNLSKRIDEYITKIKQQERNSNVVRYVRALGQFLAKDRKDMFEDPELIGLQPIPEMQIARGVDDKAWFASEDEPAQLDEEDRKQLQLFTR